MRKAILPLLLIITMVLATSVATARDFKATGAIDSANGWTTTGAWVNDIVDGVRVASYTNDATMVLASHPVETQASQQFSYEVMFKINDVDNYFKSGLVAGGHEYAIEYKGGKFYFNGAELGPNTYSPTNNYWAKIRSDDGKVWYGAVYGGVAYERAVTVNGIPAIATLALKKTNADYSPVIYDIVFISPGMPASASPSPTAQPVEQPEIGESNPPVYDVEKVQSFYDNVYPILYGSQANFGMTTSAPATSPATTGFTLSGTVTSAADGSAIADASVVLNDKLQKTDSLGSYKFEGVANGAVEVAVSADGFAAQTQSATVDADKVLNFALDKVATGGSPIASAANETNVTNQTMPGNATMVPTMAPTTVPSPTQTKSPGFEGIVAAIAIIGAAGVLVYMNRKR